MRNAIKSQCSWFKMSHSNVVFQLKGNNLESYTHTHTHTHTHIQPGDTVWLLNPCKFDFRESVTFMKTCVFK